MKKMKENWIPMEELSEFLEYLKSEDRYFSRKELREKFNITNEALENKINYLRMFYVIRCVRGKGYHLIRWDEKTNVQEMKKIIKELDVELESLNQLKKVIEKQIRPVEINKIVLSNKLKALKEKSLKE